jgi:hypothetical protein
MENIFIKSNIFQNEKFKFLFIKIDIKKIIKNINLWFLIVYGYPIFHSIYYYFYF